MSAARDPEHDGDRERSGDAETRRRWGKATLIVAVFLLALFFGYWVGQDAFASQLLSGRVLSGPL